MQSHGSIYHFIASLIASDDQSASLKCPKKSTLPAFTFIPNWKHRFIPGLCNLMKPPQLSLIKYLKPAVWYSYLFYPTKHLIAMEIAMISTSPIPNKLHYFVLVLNFQYTFYVLDITSPYYCLQSSNNSHEKPLSKNATTLIMTVNYKRISTSTLLPTPNSTPRMFLPVFTIYKPEVANESCSIT